jgi:hypothetical protein
MSMLDLLNIGETQNLPEHPARGINIATGFVSASRSFFLKLGLGLQQFVHDLGELEILPDSVMPLHGVHSGKRDLSCGCACRSMSESRSSIAVA